MLTGTFVTKLFADKTPKRKKYRILWKYSTIIQISSRWKEYSSKRLPPRKKLPVGDQIRLFRGYRWVFIWNGVSSRIAGLFGNGSMGPSRKSACPPTLQSEECYRRPQSFRPLYHLVYAVEWQSLYVEKLCGRHKGIRFEQDRAMIDYAISGQIRNMSVSECRRYGGTPGYDSRRLL